MLEYLAVGSYSEPILFGTGQYYLGQGDGIYICKFENGVLKTLSVKEARNPSYICFNRTAKKLYAVNELKEYMGELGGGVTQYSINDDMSLKTGSTFCTGGKDPCYVSMLPSHSGITITNYSSGSVSYFPLDGDGNILMDREVYQHYGHGSNCDRQSEPHAHSCIFDENNGIMYVADLGIDMLKAYKISGHKLCPLPAADIPVKAGYGPRCAEFSPENRHLYVINELKATIVHYNFDNGNDIYIKGEYPINSDGYTGPLDGADIHITGNGRYLYASNRGNNTIVCFSVAEDGSLAFIGAYDCGGKTPRNFAIDPSSQYLLVANQDSNNIVVFSIMENGSLTREVSYDYGSPVCIKFL